MPEISYEFYRKFNSTMRENEKDTPTRWVPNFWKLEQKLMHRQKSNVMSNDGTSIVLPEYY